MMILDEPDTGHAVAPTTAGTRRRGTSRRASCASATAASRLVSVPMGGRSKGFEETRTIPRRRPTRARRALRLDHLPERSRRTSAAPASAPCRWVLRAGRLGYRSA